MCKKCNKTASTGADPEAYEKYARYDAAHQQFRWGEGCLRRRDIARGWDLGGLEPMDKVSLVNSC